MAVFRFQGSWEPLRDLERQVDRLLEAIPFTFPAFRVERQFPPINVYDLDGEYLLTAELPGVAAEALELTVAPGVLTIKGGRAAPADAGDEQFRRHERMWGQWERAIPLPDRVLEDRVSAECNDGILRIHLPKSAEPNARQIQVAQSNANGA